MPRVSVWISASDLPRIDRARGKQSRSAYLVESALKCAEPPPPDDLTPDERHRFRTWLLGRIGDLM